VTDFVPKPRNSSSRQLSTLLLACGLLSIASAAQAVEPAPLSRFEIAQTSTSSSYTTVFVNPNTGNNAGDGSQQSPFKTLTHALSVAPANSIISLAPGLYNSANGETFPLMLKSGVTVQGEPIDRGQNVIIQGSGQYLSRTFARQQITVLGSDRAGLRGVTVSNPDPQGYGLWIESSSPIVSDSTFTQSGHDGVSIVGNSAPILKNNYFYQNGANGITIYGTSRPEIRDSIFEKTGFGINIAQNAAPRLIGNRITQNKDGIVVQGSAAPIFRSNVIDGNERDGLVAIANARPDLGTQSDQGNNTFLNNGALDINAKSNSQIIPVAGNQYSKTSGRLDNNAIETIAAQPAPTVRWSTTDQRSSTPPLAPVQTRVQTPVAIRPLAQPSATLIAPAPIASVVKSIPPAVTATVAPAVTPIPTIVPTPLAASAGPQEFTFRRPDVASARSAMPTTPSLTTPSLPNPTNPTPLAALPSELIVPIAVQPGAGSGRSLPVPKPAKMKATLPTSMTFNNLVLPNQANPTPQPPNSNLLRVPGSNIPVGNVGDSVSVWRQPGRRTATAQPTERPANLKHRVIVEMADAEALKSIVPGAFAVFSSGRQVMQAGAFGDADKANQLLQTLTSQGIRATAEKF
jgi:parallel beta-helix repeat protein